MKQALLPRHRSVNGARHNGLPMRQVLSRTEAVNGPIRHNGEFPKKQKLPPNRNCQWLDLGPASKVSPSYTGGTRPLKRLECSRSQTLDLV